jgi:hypothetical protein
MAARTIPVDAFDLVIFGATGDLALRKILPALYRRFLAGQMPADAQIVGAARSALDDAAYRARAREALGDRVAGDKRDPAILDAFLDLLFYVRIDATGDGRLGRAVRPAAARTGCMPSISRSRRACSPPWPNVFTPMGWPAPRRGSSWKSRSATIWPRPGR